MTAYRRVYISKDGTKPMLFDRWTFSEKCDRPNGAKSLSLKIGYKARMEVVENPERVLNLALDVLKARLENIG